MYFVIILHIKTDSVMGHLLHMYLYVVLPASVFIYTFVPMK